MIPDRREVAACILGGGRGARLGGVAKPLIQVGGETIVDRLARVLDEVAAEVTLSLAEPGQIATSLPVIVDEDPAGGALGALISALAATRRPWLVVVAGDMPKVRRSVLEVVLGHAGPGVDAVIAEVAGRRQPLCAVYHRKALPVLRARLERGARRLVDLSDDPMLRVVVPTERELRAVDPELESFFNVNEPGDLAALGARASSTRS